MNESNTKIHYTTDYGYFKFLRGNRDLSQAKVNKIIKSVNSGLNFFRYCPVMVNQDHFIIDGQHRFVACKMLKLPVYFVIVNDFSLRQIAEINNNQSKWKVKDFMHCYIDAGINKQDYETLEKLTEEYNINISTGIKLLMYGRVGTGGMNDPFRDGEFKVNFYDKTITLLDRAKDYEPFGAEWKSRSFLQAIEKLLASEAYDHAQVLKKLETSSLEIEKQSSYKEYLQHIEELYNHRCSIRKLLY